MKNLNVTGDSIKHFEVEKTTEELMGKGVDVIHLTVESDRVYKFRICRDDREPNLDITKIHIENMLIDSVDNLRNFSVTKYKDRNYLFVNDVQYTGVQLK